MSISKTESTKPLSWNTPWPSQELQEVPCCPVCKSPDRLVLHEDLVDNVFFVAPGLWTLHQCLKCQSAYLDPRPDEISIGKAYGTYYTHSSGNGTRNPISELSFLRRIRRLLANGYVNHRFGTQRHPCSWSGVVLLSLFPRVRQGLDSAFRFLPKPKPGQTLLDVGCGNGNFLSIAAEAGWTVYGIDPDPKAMAVASSKGFDVRQGDISIFSKKPDFFDVITLSHVIEHVHHPEAVVKAALKLLKPGGVLYVDTPNIQSHGAAQFERNWRGLETPRHLVIFSRKALTNLLTEAGFSQLRFKRRTAVRKGMALSSLRMQENNSPYENEPACLPLFHWLKVSMPRPYVKEEFLTVLAYKDKR